MTTAGPPFCWPCRHYRSAMVSHGPIPGMHPLDNTCAAFPEGIPPEILGGGFDHREPHPHDNGVRFEMRTDEAFDWAEQKTNDFLDRHLRRYNERQLRIKALRARDEARTDVPPGSLERFTAPIPVRTGEDAIRAAAAWEEYRLTGDPEALYEARIWARPE